MKNNLTVKKVLLHLNQELLAAAHNNDVEAIEKALYEGAQADTVDEQGNTFLHLMIEHCPLSEKTTSIIRQRKRVPGIRLFFCAAVK